MRIRTVLYICLHHLGAQCQLSKLWRGCVGAETLAEVRVVEVSRQVERVPDEPAPLLHCLCHSLESVLIGHRGSDSIHCSGC
jgi:hypothetical protein